MSKKKKRIKGIPHRILTISEDPAGENNRILKGGCEEIEDIDQGIRQTAADLKVTLLNAQAIGLAAPQIGVSGRITATRMGRTAIVLINPEIIGYDDQNLVTSTEMCLSIPGIERKVNRYSEVTVRGYRPDGAGMDRMVFGGMMAKCMQHEIDHLNGVLITDY